MEKSRQLTLNPFQGYSEDEKNIMNPDMRHALHAFAVLDGAFIVREDGVVVAAGRYLNFDEEKDLDVPLGLGARHMAAAGISRDTDAIAIVVSQTSGSVRVFRRGKAAMSWRPACPTITDPRARLSAARAYPLINPHLNRPAVFAGAPLPDTMRAVLTASSGSSIPAGSSIWCRSRSSLAASAPPWPGREKARQLFQQGIDLLRPRAVRQGDRGLAQGYRPETRSGVPLQHRPGLPAAGDREGDLLLQGLPAELAQGGQPRTRSSRRSRRCRSRWANRAPPAAARQHDTAPPPANDARRRLRRVDHGAAARGRRDDAGAAAGRDDAAAAASAIPRRPPSPRRRRRRRSANRAVDAISAALGPAFWASGVSGTAEAVVRVHARLAATRSASRQRGCRFRLGGAVRLHLPQRRRRRRRPSLVPARPDAGHPVPGRARWYADVDFGLGVMAITGLKPSSALLARRRAC